MSALPAPYQRLTVLRVLPGKHRRAEVRCECGTEKTVFLDSVLSGHTKSCGCLQRELGRARGKANATHGEGKSRLYRIWTNMRRRTTSPRSNSWAWYGAKGIRVCDEWQDFARFRKWALESGYADDLTIERVDHDGHYEPDNCEWITASENFRRAARNRWATSAPMERDPRTGRFAGAGRE